MIKKNVVVSGKRTRPLAHGVVGASVWLMAAASAAHAHDIEGLISEWARDANGVPASEIPEGADRVGSASEVPPPLLDDLLIPDLPLDPAPMPSTPGIGLPGSPDISVFDKNAAWTKQPDGKSTVIKVCFYGGSAEVRQRIKQIANMWIYETRIVNGMKTLVPRARVRFDFNLRDCSYRDAYNAAFVRVAFDPNAGNKSAIGRWSYWTFDKQKKKYVRTPGATMNLAVGAAEPGDAGAFQTTVLHEFGHALGLKHEHQHPQAPCDWDKPAVLGLVRANFPRGPSESSDKYEQRVEQIYETNLVKLVGSDSRPFLVTPYDKTSIMHYVFSAKHFISREKSKCALDRRALVFSQQDIEMLKYVYK